MKKTIALATILAGFICSVAHAEESHFTAAVTGGTLGVGPEVGFRLNDTFGIRANATFLSVHHGFHSDDIDYHGTVHLKSGGAMIDLYPFGGGFRISAGARINGNNGRVSATPTGPIDIGNTSYVAPAGSFVRGKADTKNFAPALSLGYGGGNHHGFMWGIEAGALFEGRVRIRDFTTNIPGVTPADLEEERQSIQHDVDKFKVYPIGQLIFGWRF